VEDLLPVLVVVADVRRVVLGLRGHLRGGFGGGLASAGAATLALTLAAMGMRVGHLLSARLECAVMGLEGGDAERIWVATRVFGGGLGRFGLFGDTRVLLGLVVDLLDARPFVVFGLDGADTVARTGLAASNIGIRVCAGRGGRLGLTRGGACGGLRGIRDGGSCSFTSGGHGEE
jgi:hypothetical protein